MCETGRGGRHFWGAVAGSQQTHNGGLEHLWLGSTTLEVFRHGSSWNCEDIPI